MTLRVVLVWCVTCLLWSSTFLFIKIGVAHVPPFTFAWIRLAIASAVLIPAATLRHDWRALRAGDVVRIASIGVLLLGVNYALLFWGTQFVSSALVAILQSSTPVIALLLGWLLKSETPTTRKFAALALGVAGVAAIFGAEALGSGRAGLVGAATVVGSSTCVALSYVWFKTYGQHVPKGLVTGIQAVAGMIPLACLAFAVDGRPHPSAWPATAWVALLYLSLAASVVAFWLNYWLLARMDTSAMLMMGVAEVPIAVGLGAVVLGERVPSGTLLGGAAVLAGVVLALLDARAGGRPADAG